MPHIDGKPAGYKVYYDGEIEKFVADTSLSVIEEVPDDGTISWVDNASMAEFIAANENDKLNDHFGIEVKKCKSCGEYFIQTYDERAWYEHRDLKPPVRCAGCREKRRLEKK